MSVISHYISQSWISGLKEPSSTLPSDHQTEMLQWFPCMERCMHHSVTVGLSTVGMLEANLTLNPIGLEALTWVLAAGLLVAGASHWCL